MTDPVFNPVVATLLASAQNTAETSRKISEAIYPKLKRLDALVSENCARLVFDRLDPDERIALAQANLDATRERKALVEQLRPYIDLIKGN